jgi:hypothetical protein
MTALENILEGLQLAHCYASLTHITCNKAVVEKYYYHPKAKNITVLKN